MKRVLVTGSAGFLGRNLVVHLRRRSDVEVMEYDLGSSASLSDLVSAAHVVYHLAGVNRPENPEEYDTGNRGLTAEVCDAAAKSPTPPLIMLSSSIQATLDNPYGRSKLAAEQVLKEYAERTGAVAVAYRFPNLFGKWSRPNYNSAVATFCHNIARDLPITISDPARELQLVYVDDAVRSMLGLLDEPGPPGFRFEEVEPVYRITLGELVERIRTIRKSRDTLFLPDMADPFNRCLLATYNSFLPEDGWAYDLPQRTDDRGTLAEFVKTEGAGQIFVSTTRPGVVRGNHYHHTKVEKFLVLSGEAEIRLRLVGTDEVRTVRVSGTDLRVVDIPPGWTHCIQNVGTTDMITLFWASEPFDPANPDTYAEPVDRA